MTKKILVVQDFDFPREDVFNFFGDHDRFGSALPVPVKRIVDSADSNPSGEGSVRKIGVGPLGVEETILTCESPSQIQYTISKGGGPIKNYLSTIDFIELGPDQCRVEYNIEFDFPLPLVADVMAKGMEKVFSDLLEKISANRKYFS